MMQGPDPFHGVCHPRTHTTDDNSAAARKAGAGASAGRRPELFAMEGALFGERVKFTADFTQDFTARP